MNYLQLNKLSSQSRFSQGCMLLLLVHSVLVVSLPALDATPPDATPNTIEESDKLPDHDREINNLTQTGIVDTFNSNETDAAETQEQSAVDNVASASNVDSSAVYANGLITPEAFQQYLSQYGAAAGFAPYAGAYPAPIAAAPGLYPYPGPIVVQTGYEGYLVPTTTAASSTSSSTTTEVSSTTATPSRNPLLAFISNLLPSILMSTLFRVLAAVVSAVGMILFGGAITNALCRLTSICDISNKTVEYLRSAGGAEDVGRMLAEEITPERVRRATEFVRNAIRKYRQLQKFADANNE